MNKKTRDILFRIFVFLFIVITTVLSLYATGYRLNLSWPLRFDKILIKTGTLALDTVPKNAIVNITGESKINTGLSFLNSKKAETTPIKIKNLLPGEYLITFSLDGYWPYQKKLRVNPEQTTFLEDVILFKKSLPLNVYHASAQRINYSPNGKYALLENNKLIINLENEQTIDLKTEKEVIWLENDKITNGSRVVNLNDNSFTDYSNYTDAIKKSELSNDLLIYQVGSNLSSLNIKTGETNLIQFEGNVINYQVSNGVLFIAISNNGKTEIKSYDLKNNKFINSATLLNSKDFSFQTEHSNTILLDNEHKIIYILSSDDLKIVKDIIRNANILKWLDSNKLIYTNESEIYIYDLIQTRPYLITRLSEKINSLAWSSDNYLIYATEKTIGTINLTDAGNDITVLWQGEKISSLYFNNKTGTLFFSGAIGQQSGLYKMSLK